MKAALTPRRAALSLSWGRDDRKSARWHGAGLQHVTSSSRRGRWSGGGRGGELKKGGEEM